MRRLFIVSGCGGVGRTTVAANLAHALAARGTSVRLQDTDPQQSLAVHFQAFERSAQSRSTGIQRSPSSRSLAPNIELMPAASAAPSQERSYADRDGSGTIDIIDTPVNGELVPIGQGLDDHFLVVISPEARCFRTLPGILERFEASAPSDNGGRLIGLVNVFEPESALSRDTSGLIERAFGERLLQPFVLRDQAVPEAFASGLPVTEYAPWSQAAEAFGQLADSLIARRYPRHAAA